MGIPEEEDRRRLANVWVEMESVVKNRQTSSATSINTSQSRQVLPPVFVFFSTSSHPSNNLLYKWYIHKLNPQSSHPPVKSDMSKIVPTTFYIYQRLFLPCSPHSPSLPVHAGYYTPSTCLQLMQILSGTSQTAGRWVVGVTKRLCNFPRWSILY